MKQLFLFTFILSTTLHGLAQRGKDGSYTVTSLNALVNSYTVLNANASAGQTLITVASNNMVGGFFQGVLTPGDLIMIIQMQGATLNVDTYPASEYVSSNGQFWGPYTTPQGTNTFLCGVKLPTTIMPANSSSLRLNLFQEPTPSV